MTGCVLIDNAKSLINALGYKVLEPVLQVDFIVVTADDDLLCISTGGATKTGRIAPEGFVILKRATGNEKDSSKSPSTGIVKLRGRYFK